MDDCGDYSLSRLEKCSYRFLQRTAKAMALPSNVKKVYLIQLINTKICGTPGQVDAIMDHVKNEKLVMSRRRNRTKKKRLQNTEVSSSSNPHYELNRKSPAISLTPKHSVVYSQHPRNLLRFKPDGTPLQTYHNKKSECNMVLRNRTHPTNVRKTYGGPSNLSGFKTKMCDGGEPNNLNALKKEMYDDREPLSVLKKLNAKMPQDVRVVIRNMDGFPANPRGPAGGHRPLLAGPAGGKTAEVPKRLVGPRPGRPEPSCVAMTPPPTPAKRPRALSGIYPIQADPQPVTYQYVPSDIAIRNRDGTFSKINALVQRPTKPSPAGSDLEGTIRSILQSTCEETARNKKEQNLKLTENNNNNLQNPVTQTANAYVVETPVLDTPMSIRSRDLRFSIRSSDLRQSIDEEPSEVEYCHKKIRSEQVRERRASELKRERDALPKIHEVFTSFNDVSNGVIQPMYTVVTDGSNITLPPLPAPSAPVQRLEALYNILLPPRDASAPTDNMRSVWTTPMITTPTEYPATAYNAQYYLASCEQAELLACNPYNYVMCDQDLVTRQDMSSPLSHMASQVSEIPELGQDELEVISQDGDYTERMDVECRKGCVLCAWTGPSCYLINHVKKEHASRVHELTSQEWNVTYQLGTVARESRCELLECVHTGALYALTAHYRDPDTFMCEIQRLNLESELPVTCTLTVYNRVTGEPFSWTGVVPQSSTPGSGLGVHLSSLDLLPNSARLQLINGVLVGNGSVLCGQPELDDIQVIVFVKI